MIKLFEDFDPPIKPKKEIWLFPTSDGRFKDAIYSSKFTKFNDPILRNVGLKSAINDDKYVFMIYIDLGMDYERNWEWANFNSYSLDWLLNKGYELKGCIGMSEEEYENVIMSLRAEKYNL